METRPPVSPDGMWWWNGQQWQPIATYPAPRTPVAAVVPPPATAPAALPAVAAAGRDPEDRPSWLPAESAQVVFGGAATPAATGRSPAAGGPAASQPAPQPQLPPDGSSTWVQQNYRSGGTSPAKSGVSRLLIAGAAILILAIASGGAYVYQQRGADAGPAPDAAHLPAAALLSGARTAIGSAGTYHLVGTSGAVSQEITVAGPKDATIDLKSPSGTVSMLATGGLQFLKAPAVFYSDKNLALKSAADQWIIVPSEESLTPLTSVVNLAKTAECLVGRHGTLKKVGLATMDGQPVVEVDDRGEVPAGTPANFFFTRDSGQLVGIDVVGASTPGGNDPTCGGGLGIYSPTFTSVQKYRFDHWGSVFRVMLPGGIDLTQKPWCGTIIGSGLSAAVQQFLLAAYTFNQKATAIEADCGCHALSFLVFKDSAMAEINASDDYARSVDGIAFQGQAKVDANAFVAAFRARNAILRQGLATGTFAGWHSFDAQRAPYEDARGLALTKLRTDLGLPPGLCTYVMA